MKVILLAFLILAIGEGGWGGEGQVIQSTWCNIFRVALREDSTTFGQVQFDADVKAMGLTRWVKLNVKSTEELSQKYAQVARAFPRQKVVVEIWFPKAIDALANANDKAFTALQSEWAGLKGDLNSAKQQLEEAKKALEEARRLLNEANDTYILAKPTGPDYGPRIAELETKIQQALDIANKALNASQTAAPNEIVLNPTFTLNPSFNVNVPAQTLTAPAETITQKSAGPTASEQAEDIAPSKTRKTFFVLGGNAGVGGGGMNYTIIDAFVNETNAEVSSSPSAGSIRVVDPSFSPRFSARLASVSNYSWLFKSAKPSAKPTKRIWGWAGWGLQYDYMRSYQRGVASKVLFYDFNSENNIFTPGIQLLSPGRGVGLFVGLVGIGHSRVDFTPGPNYNLVEDLIELGLNQIGKELDENFPEGRPRADFNTEIYPVVLKVLPIQLDIWCFGPIGLNIAFSGLQLWAGESALNLDWEDGTNKTIDTGFVWIRNFQIEIGLSLKLF